MIIPYHADYKSFLKMDVCPGLAAIVANFAVLSVIPDLPRLFRAFAALVPPSGHVIVSVLNPLYWRDMLHPWWWKGYLRSRGKGMIQIPGRGPRTWRYFPATMLAAAALHFIRTKQTGIGVLIGKRVHGAWCQPISLTERLEQRLWKKRLFRDLGQFTFFVFQRVASDAHRRSD